MTGDMSAQVITPVALSPKEVAHRLNVSVNTLQNWRNRCNAEVKVGPPYYRLVTKIIYYQHEVDEWREQTKWG